MSENEVWKDVPNYEGLYKVSNKGNVYSVERKNSRGIRCGGQTLKPVNNNRGYLRIGLHKNGVREHKLIHRLVAEAFLPNPNNFLEVNHLDEIKDNNELSNLEWCDTRYNVNYGTRNRRVGRKLSKKVRAINVKSGEVLIFNSTREAEKKGFPHGKVSEACRGIYCGGNLYRGHRWRYV